MNLIYGTANELDNMYLSMGRFRYDVFVNTMGWDLPDADRVLHLEFDEFDTARAIYVVGLDGRDAVMACARLTVTTEPYLLKEKFPHLATDYALPDSNDVWELSRLAVRPTGSAPFSNTKRLFEAALLLAKDNGANQVVGVLTTGMERLYRRIGFRLQRLGAPIKIQGEAVTACMISTELTRTSEVKRSSATSVRQAVAAIV